MGQSFAAWPWDEVGCAAAECHTFPGRKGEELANRSSANIATAERIIVASQPLSFETYEQGVGKVNLWLVMASIWGNRLS